jgi:hypothetical protein
MRNINEMSLKELAEYAVTLPDWRWMRGMVDSHDEIVKADIASAYWKTPDLLPDLKDPATVGCVMAMVRKKYGKHAFVRYSVSFDEWCVGTSADILVEEMPTEAHALIAALAKELP